MEHRPILLAGLAPDAAEIVSKALHNVAHIAGTEPDARSALDGLDTKSPPVVLLGIDKDPIVAFDVLAQLKAREVKVIVLGTAKDADTILRALRAGAAEFVLLADAEDMRRAVRTLTAPATVKSSATVTTVFPVKGGTGATAIAVNLAGALQRGGERTCLIDLDLHFGDVLSFLDLSGTYSIADVISNIRRLDRDLLDSSVTHHSSGVAVLAQSGKIEDAEAIRVADLETLFAFLRQHYDRVVVDGVRGFEEVGLAALDASDCILVVVTQDVPSIRNAQRCLELFRQLGYPEALVHLIVNRYQKRAKIDLQVIQEAASVPVARTLANDYASLIRAINRGVMLTDEAPRSQLTADIEGLVPLARGIHAKPSPKGLLSGLWPRKAVQHGA
jgi:pilus assembly protein CpaE